MTNKLNTDILAEHEIDIEFREKIVWATIKAPISSQAKCLGVKYSETKGDKALALNLAIERITANG